MICTKERMTDLERKIRNFSNVSNWILGICFVGAVFALIVILMDNIIEVSNKEIIFKIVVAVGIPGAIISQILHNKSEKYKSKYIDLTTTQIIFAIRDFGLDKKEFNITHKSRNSYTIKFKNRDINFKDIHDEIKSSLRWIEEIMNEDIKLHLVYEYKE